MDIKEYGEAIAKEFSARNSGLTAECQDINKNNNVKLHGMVIRNNSNIAPTIYIDNLYNNNLSVHKAVEQIEELYNKHKNDFQGADAINFDDLFKFDTVKDFIVLRVVNKDMNKAHMKKCPYIEFGDLIVMFHIVLENLKDDSIASVRVTNSFMKKWNTDINTLYKIAMENTKKRFPLKFDSVTNVLISILENTGRLTDESKHVLKMQENPLHIITTDDGRYGSYFITDKETLLNVTNELNVNEIVILPASLHELLVVPKKLVSSMDSIKDLVQTVNYSDVGPEDVLSDNVYIFNKNSEELKMFDGTSIPFIA